MTIKTTSVKFALGFLMLGLAGTAMAQSTDGTIRGVVLDPSGALVPQAQVTVTSAAGFSRTLKSNGNGAFEVPHLAPGSYSVSINAVGFTPALEGIQVSGNQITNENVKLGISLAQEIEVSADDDATTAR